MIEADGAIGPVEGLRRITNVVAKLTVNLLEHTLLSWGHLMTGSSTATAFVDWDGVSRAGIIAAGDYISNVALIAEVSGSTDSFGFVIDNAIVDSNFEMSVGPKEEGVVPMTFTGHFAADALTTEPWHIYQPTAA